MKSKILSSRFFKWFLYRAIRTYSLFFRLEVRNESPWFEFLSEQGGTVLLCVYHQQFFAAIRYFRKYKKYKPALMISQSKDGEIIAGVAQRSGWWPVRGSSSRGGSAALKKMISHLKEYHLAVHIVDGPVGPAFKVKAGAIKLAQASGAAIVPFYISADRAWYFRSWDTFMIPKPFSRVIMQFGTMIPHETTADSDDFEARRLSLEETMHRDNEELKKTIS